MTARKLPALLLALLLALAPVAYAAPLKTASLPRPLAAVPADAYEPGDDLQAGATDLTPHVPHDADGYPSFGEDAYVETHTISPETTTVPDIDWYKVEVTPKDLELSAFSLMIDTYSPDGGDTVIEAYTATMTPGEPTAGKADPEAFAADDDCGWFGVSSSLMLRPKQPGTYYIRVRPYRQEPWLPVLYAAAPFSYELRIKVGQTTRVAGVDRIDTANRIADIAWRDADISGASVPTVTIASGYNYPDALAGAMLASVGSGTYDIRDPRYAGMGPLLLVKPHELPASVLDTLHRKHTKAVYLLGSTSTIGSEVEEALADDGIKVVRLAGTDRVRTAAAIARRAAGISPAAPRLAFVAYGWNFPDALAATPIAYADRVPILLTRSGSQLDTVTALAIQDLGITDVVILGGVGTVSAAVEHDLGRWLSGEDHVYRIAGLDRYDTAVRLARWATDLDGPGERGDGRVGTEGSPDLIASIAYDRVGFASGENFPDALTGGALTGFAGGPLLLTKRVTTPAVLFGADGEIDPGAGQHQYFDGPAIGRSMLFGGVPTVSDNVFRMLDQGTGFAGPGY